MKKQKGFTLIELMVSISIVAILTALATVSFTAAQKKARDSRRVQDIKALQIAAEQYIALDGQYPNSATAPWETGGQMVLEKMPNDPKNDADYSYSLNIGTTGYCVCAPMENSNAGNANTAACGFSDGGGLYFCAKNQQ